MYDTNEFTREILCKEDNSTNYYFVLCRIVWKCDNRIEFVTWKFDESRNIFIWGKYHTEYIQALKNFVERVV